jgi:endonuclease/exonuclease/phosphatase family metal-dependent hydrolase
VSARGDEPDGSGRNGLEQNPLVLVGAFAAVAALLLGVFVLVGRANDTPPMTGPGAATASSGPTATAAPTGRDPSPTGRDPSPTGTDLRGDVEGIQPGQQLTPKQDREVPLVEPGRTGRTGSGLVLGEIPDIDAPVSDPVRGTVTTAVANIPNRTSDAGFADSMRALVGPGSDFLFLNEVSRHGTDELRALAPGYDAYRDPAPDGGTGGGQHSMTNAVLWRSDTWRLVDAGRVKLVEDDRTFYKRRAVTWDRYATWAVLQRPSDRAVVSVVSTHMMTNPGKYPQQHGRVGQSRVSQYARGMDVLIALTRTLERFGPVLVGGDMNSHPGQGSWTAAAKMGGAGYRYVKDSAVMHLFFRAPVTVLDHRQVRVVSDHPAIVTTLDLAGSGPSAGQTP